jgi:two-component system, NtrC family, response regulator PilR
MLAKPCRRKELEDAIIRLIGSESLSRPHSGGGLRILLAEDDRVFAAILCDLLSLQGHHVVLVDSVSAAFAALSTGRYDVLLTDYRLGDMTGQELAAHIAESADAPFVVLITGYATQVDDPVLLTSGVDAVLPKPCRPAELDAVLARAANLGIKQQSRGAR